MMVVVAQLVERFSVEEEVTGAEPVYHPLSLFFHEKDLFNFGDSFCFEFCLGKYTCGVL